MAHLEKRMSTDSLDTASVDSDQSLSEWLGEHGLSHLVKLLNENGVHDIPSLTIDASLDSLPYLPRDDKDLLLSALKGADLNQEVKDRTPKTMPGNAMEDELDDIMDQFLEMERELGSVGESDTVKLRKKSPVTSTSTTYRMSIMALGDTDEKDLDSLLDDLCNDMDDIHATFSFQQNPSPTTPMNDKQFSSAMSLENLPPPAIFEDTGALPAMPRGLPPPPPSPGPSPGYMPPPPPQAMPRTPPPPTRGVPPPPPPPPDNDDLNSALDDLESDVTGMPFMHPVSSIQSLNSDDNLGMLPPPMSSSIYSLTSESGISLPPPPEAMTPLHHRTGSRPVSSVSNDRPVSLLSASDNVRASVCTTSSGTSSHSAPSTGSANQRNSLYTMSTTPHSTLSKSSGVSSYLSSSSSSEFYDSKLSLDSSSTDYRENDFKQTPLSVPIRVPDTEPFLVDQDPSPTTPITPGPKSIKIQRRLTMILKDKDNENLTEAEKASLLKKEKLKIAIEKLRVASNLKVAMKAYNVDNSSKTMWVEQKQTAWEICQILAEKNYFKPGADWSLMEHITDLEIERELEDHEIVYDVLNSWSRDSTNKMYFRNNARKHELFRRPQLYLHTEDSYANVVDLSRECRQVLIDDFFSGTANTRIPSIGLKGVHWLKSGKKSWRKMNFVIRDSGIYYAGKAKNKSLGLAWTSFSRTEDNDIFLPSNNKEFKKQHKAPTEYCFLVRTKTNTRDQHKSTRCICVENELKFRLWTNALRRLKYGVKLLDDNKAAMDWLDKLSKEQDGIQQACLSPTLQNFKFGDPNRASVILPDMDDNMGDIFAERFGAAWNNGENASLREAPSLCDVNLETDTQGMTLVRLHK